MALARKKAQSAVLGKSNRKAATASAAGMVPIIRQIEATALAATTPLPRR